MPSMCRVYHSKKLIPIAKNGISEVELELEGQVRHAIDKVPLDHRGWQHYFSGAENDSEQRRGVITEYTQLYGYDGMVGSSSNHNNKITVRYLFDGHDKHLVLATLSGPTIEREKIRSILRNILGVYDEFFGKSVSLEW